MASVDSEAPNVYAYRGRHLLSAYHERNKHVPDHKLSKITPILRNPAPTADLPVCIIGAGMAGLYTAMIFESLGISYQIIDANTKERVGGRLFTYRFPDGVEYDYYDVGAMRFPDTPFMKRTFDLAKNRGLQGVRFIPYIMQMVHPQPNTWLLYNNARVNNQDSFVSGDPFNVKDYVTDKSLTTPQGVSKRVGEVLEPFRNLFRPPPPGGQRRDIATAMDMLFAQSNVFSMRSYMLQNGMNPKDIHWCETLDKSTGWYDRALTETVIESLAFDWPTTPLPGPEKPKSDPNIGWYCFDRGSSSLPYAMFKSLSQGARDGALFKGSVTAISLEGKGPDEVMRIAVNGEEYPRKYSAVISTVPLPRLSLMDLTGADIHRDYTQWSAIRELQYGAAIKIGMKFSKAWWGDLSPQYIQGGQSYTDLPLRTIVYPSYPENSKPGEESGVLIASYCWTQDAERLGALIHPDGTAEKELIDMVLRDLAAVHGVEVKFIKKYYRNGDYFAWDWLHDPLTMGGYAFFGPGVYDKYDIYSEMLRPAARGKLFFAGEATSACHAWVAGALDSAWRAVHQYLTINHPNDKALMEKFKKKWGETEYWDEAGNKDLVDLNNKLMERHLVISLWKSGIRLEE